MNANSNSTYPQTQDATSHVLRSKEEVLEKSRMFFTAYCYLLAQKGFKKTRMGEITAKQMAYVRGKWDGFDSVSDYDFGYAEGQVRVAIALENFYDEHFDEGHVAWMKGLISKHIDKIWCFIFKCVINKPHISTSPTYDFTGKLDAKSHDLAAVDEEYRNDINNWYCTPYELGQLCGFISAAHWTISGEWDFSEDDFDAPVDWKRFHSYLEKRASKLKKRKIQEMSPIFQMFLQPWREDTDSNSGEYFPVRSIRCKLPNRPADNKLDEPVLPKPSSWLDW